MILLGLKKIFFYKLDQSAYEKFFYTWPYKHFVTVSCDKHNESSNL